MADVQARFDSLASAFGERAPAPLTGETERGYRQRLLRPYMAYSKEFSKVSLSEISDQALFDGIETKVYADAIAAAHSPIVPKDVLQQRVRYTDAGVKIREFYGELNTWMSQFSHPVRQVISGWRQRDGSFSMQPPTI